MNCDESEFSKRGTRYWLLGADIATDQTNHPTLRFLREKFSEVTTERRVAQSDPSLTKPSGQIQVVRPEKPKRSKHPLISTSVSTLNPKDDRT